MMQQQKDDQTPVNREHWEASAQEDTVGAQPNKTPDRRHVDALLDISEETLRKELEPYEYHCYSRWEDAVWGWAKVAPLSCILMTQDRKPRQKEANNMAPLSANPTPSNADHSARKAEQHCKSHAVLHKKSLSLNHQKASWGQTEFALPNSPEKNMRHFFLQEKKDEDEIARETSLQSCQQSPKYFVLERSLSKPQKHSHKSNNIMVPIKNFTFLPPIKSLQLNPREGGHVCKAKKVPDAETLEENLFILDKSGTRRTRVGTVANSNFHTNSAYQKYQQNLHFIPALQVSVPENYYTRVFQT